jgi:superfamily II DNA or RNA helicase
MGHNEVMDVDPLTLTFDGGTVAVAGGSPTIVETLPGIRPDPRTNGHRAEGRYYRAIVECLRAKNVPYTDSARAWQPTSFPIVDRRAPFPHQTEALDVWWKSGGRGIVVLPTGTGKTYLAIMAIERVARPTLVVTPTIDLLNQWYGELLNAFGVPIGLLGGGHYELQPLTVATYDSAYLHVERWGSRFGLVVFDECHHLPGPSFLFTAVGSLAPYRLGLTATPERPDGQDSLYNELIGPVNYRREIKQLAGEFLAEYTTRQLHVDLSPAELARYRACRDEYRRFLDQNGISLSGPQGWQRFLVATYRSADGRAAFQAYREQKRLSMASPAKLHKLAELLERHRRDRVLIFTYDNATVYEIARRFLVPAITHQTKAKERRQILERFHSGDYTTVVTSRVLNEGVDVPAASVGIVLSGTSTVREHVQRLGRLLRKHGDKQAILYEVVTRNTAEEFTSERRRQHHAYQ